MLVPKVKICGITNYEDAAAALDLGADMLGFNFYPGSPRYIDSNEAAKIISKLPGFVDITGVFVNASFDRIREVIEQCQLTWVQLHGDESPEFCGSFAMVNVKTMKALRVRDRADIKKVDTYFTDAVLLDAFDPERYGGTGRQFDWNVIGHMSKRVFLAGGITPENAAEAVELGVYGIDVCSGVEVRPGKKDHAKMRALFENLRFVRG